MRIAQNPITRFVIAAVLVVGPIAGTALARSPKAHTPDISSLELVMVDSTDGVVNWSDQVTFNVSTTATEKPFVRVDCYQDALVYSANAGFYDGYAWPWTQIFTLKSKGWTGGAAECTATLSLWDGRRFRDLMAIDFHVDA